MKDFYFYFRKSETDDRQAKDFYLYAVGNLNRDATHELRSRLNIILTYFGPAFQPSMVFNLMKVESLSYNVFRELIIFVNELKSATGLSEAEILNLITVQIKPELLQELLGIVPDPLFNFEVKES